MMQATMNLLYGILALSLITTALQFGNSSAQASGAAPSRWDVCLVDEQDAFNQAFPAGLSALQYSLGRQQACKLRQCRAEASIVLADFHQFCKLCSLVRLTAHVAVHAAAPSVPVSTGVTLSHLEKKMVCGGTQGTCTSTLLGCPMPLIH